MMKILSVTTSLLGADAASWRIWNIARILQSKGHEVHLVRYVRKSTYEKLEGNNLDLSDIPNSVATVPVIPISIPVIQVKHWRELSKNDYDLVYGNGHLSTFCALVGNLKGMPLIFDMHGSVQECLVKPNLLSICSYLLYGVAQFFNLRLSTKVCCVSKRMIEYLHANKRVPLEKMAYVTNGVDLDFFQPTNINRVQILKRQLGLEDQFVFGYIGNFTKWQGVENLIEAAERIDDPKLAFIVVGGDDKPRKRGNILFIPKIHRNQTPDYYSICDVLVLPRPSHPATEVASPTKFAEYSAMGKPVLTTNVGDAAELVRKYDCGIIVENNSPRALADGIMQFRSKSESELKTAGQNSRMLADEQFDWSKVASSLLKVIDEIA